RGIRRRRARLRGSPAGSCGARATKPRAARLRETAGSGATRSGSSGATSARRSRGLRHAAGLQLEEHLVVPDHAEFRAGALLDRLAPGLEVAHVRVERLVAGPELLVALALPRELPVEFADREPAA